MTADERRTIGLDRSIRIEWLDAVAGRLAARDSPEAAREYAWDLLKGVVAGDTTHTARGKTLTVLARVWLTPPPAAVWLRDAALEFVGQASAGERLAIHWAMLSATYPFFVDVAGLIGKSLGLNGDVALSQLTRRLVHTWGDRSTLRPAARRIVRSMVQWRTLRDGGKAGLYVEPQKKILLPSSIGVLLVEGLLIAFRGGMPLNQLVSHPALFPFSIRTDLAALRRSGRLRVHRQGDQTDFVEREERPTPQRTKARPNTLDRTAEDGHAPDANSGATETQDRQATKAEAAGNDEMEPTVAPRQLSVIAKPPSEAS